VTSGWFGVKPGGFISADDICMRDLGKVGVLRSNIVGAPLPLEKELCRKYRYLGLNLKIEGKAPF